LERSTLKPLPAKSYEFGEWRKAKVHPDYHIEVARAYYSVPYRLIGERVDVRLTVDPSMGHRSCPHLAAGVKGCSSSACERRWRDLRAEV
jgi:hypothetical protein